MVPVELVSQIRRPAATSSSIKELREQLERNDRLQNAYLDANADVKFLSDTNYEMEGLLGAVTAELAAVKDQLVHAEMMGTVGRLLINLELATNEWDNFSESFAKVVSSYSEAQIYGIIAIASIEIHLATRDRLVAKIRLHSEHPDLAAEYPFPVSTPDLRQITISNQGRSDALLAGPLYDKLWVRFLAERTLALDRLDAMVGFIEQVVVEVRERDRVNEAPEAIAYPSMTEFRFNSILVSVDGLREILLGKQPYVELARLMAEVEAMGDLPLPSSPD